LFRQTTTSLLQVAGGSDPTFLCPICCENAREDEKVVFEDCGDEDHGCCKQCLRHWIRGLIADGRVSAIICPVGGRECAAVGVQEVRGLTDDADFEKFERFRQMQGDRQLRQCPGCGVVCKPVEEEGDVIPEMQCASCQTEFCYYHSNAHVGRPCQAYRLEIAREESLNMAGAMHGTKACPGCGIPTEKASGCNHMTCGGCHVDWCWVCSQSITGTVAWHYNPGNPGGCQQFHEGVGPSGGKLHKVLRVLMAPVMVLSIVFFVLCSLIFLFWFPVVLVLMGACAKMDVVCMVAGALTFLPFIALQLAWLPISVALTLLFVPCGARGNTLAFFAQVPFASVLATLEGLGTH